MSDYAGVTPNFMLEAVMYQAVMFKLYQ